MPIPRNVSEIGRGRSPEISPRLWQTVRCFTGGIRGLASSVCLRLSWLTNVAPVLVDKERLDITLKHFPSLWETCAY